MSLNIILLSRHLRCPNGTGLSSSISSIVSTRWMSQEHDEKQIVDKPTPYERSNRQCILCRNKIQLDYKNPRLISQFVSPLNGRVYEKHITGLCEKQQTILEVEHRKATIAMYMPIFHKNPKYNKDATIVNPDRPQRPNPY
jgi:small subunit ribosomal protein S18